MGDRAFQLTVVVVGDDPDSWARAGFTMTDGRTRIGSTTVVCDPTTGSGITGVAIDGLTDAVDGLPIGAAPILEAPAADHANHVSGFDHLVAMSPDVDRTAAALAALGLEKRRTREFEAGGEKRRQDFFWMGDVILELVGLADQHDPGPAVFWGLALECDDLHAAATALGDDLGQIKDAVQRGRQIATIRTRELGVSVPTALMSPHLRT